MRSRIRPDSIKLERTEAFELLAVVQATLNAIARSQELTVGAAILTGIKAKLMRIAKREVATLRALAEATGLSRQTIANICAAVPRTRNKARAS